MPPTARRKSAQIKDASGSFSRLLLHLHPRRVPADSIALTHTWGLGGMALVLILLQICSGILLLFVYSPDAGDAYQSIVTLKNTVLFGGLFRNIHYWSANLLAFVTFLHMLRVFYTGAFYGPRAFNWIIGLVLFGLVLAANFTGYLLPWDQLSYWAVTISTGMLDYLPFVGGGIRHLLLGGMEVSGDTLSNFFVLHVMVLPACFGVFLPFHFWRIRKAGGVVRPKPLNQAPVDTADDIGPSMVPSLPDLVVRELSAAAVVLAAVFLLAAFFDAPLHLPANPGLSPDPTKPPWYFAGAQELLVHFHPFVAAVLIPAAGILFLVIMPYFPYRVGNAGIWFASRFGRRLAAITAPATVVFGVVIILLDALIPTAIDGTSWFVGGWSGVIFTIGLSVAPVAGFLVIRKKPGGAFEIVQFFFTMLLSLMILLTIVGVWFRGPGMALMWAG